MRRPVHRPANAVAPFSPTDKYNKDSDTYNITYDDGDKEKGVKPSFITVLKRAASSSSSKKKSSSSSRNRDRDDKRRGSRDRDRGGSDADSIEDLDSRDRGRSSSKHM